MSSDPDVTPAHFESCEFPPAGEPVTIKIVTPEGSLPSLQLGDSLLHLTARPGVDLFQLDALAAEMKRLLDGVRIVHYRYDR